MRFGAQKETPAKTSQKGAPAITRQSSGLEQFCSILRSQEGLSILDMSGASQANISFITGMGHRISSDDIVGTMQECFGADFLEAQQAPGLAHRFLDQTLTFPNEFFDGALVWDALQFLTSPVLEDVVERLLRVMRPGGQMLAFFNADEKTKQIPVYNYRIQDQKTLLQIPRAGTGLQRSQFFNNRNLEKLFQKAASLKFFLTRDHLREVIVRR
jgi:SAM-dependent methyltransferase